MTEALRLEAAAFHYPQDGRGLQPVSFALQQGEALLLAGSTGSGKSTLARMACGLIPHLYHGELQGRALLFGKPTAEQPLWALSQQAGMVFQNPAAQMLTSSVEDEIIFGLENLGLEAAEIRLRLEDALTRFGLQAMRQRPPLTLSGGEQQKLALACALARRPPLLALDEPLSMLDATNARELMLHLQELQAGGQTLLICEHRQEYCRLLPALRVQQLNGAPPLPLSDPLQTTLAAPANPFTLRAEKLAVQRGQHPVLESFDISLPGGQVAVILGRNGVGKTTLLRAIAGLQPYQGRLEVHTAAGAEKPSFGMVFQNPDVQLFQASVGAEILFRVPEPDPEWYRWLLAMLDLERLEQAPPLLLSEGEKRRVALATALMRKARHGVLLDEPSLGQDAPHKALLIRTLRLLAQSGYLALVATHDLELAAQADTLLVLGAQGIVAQGRPADLLADAPLWQRLGLWLPPWVQASNPGGQG